MGDLWWQPQYSSLWRPVSTCTESGRLKWYQRLIEHISQDSLTVRAASTLQDEERRKRSTTAKVTDIPCHRE